MMKLRKIAISTIIVIAVLVVIFFTILPGTPIWYYVMYNCMVISQIPENTRRNIPLDFVGQVLDQENIPIKDVSAVFSYERCRPMGGNSGHSIRVLSDASGMVKITGIKGVTLCYESMSKDGYFFYQFPDKVRVFSYSPPNGPRYVPDMTKPELFYGWKKVGGHESLKMIYGSGPELPLNGEIVSVYLDGSALRVVPGAKTDAIWWFSAVGKYTTFYNTKTLECTYTIKSLQGGIQRCGDQFGFFAPEKGYEQQISSTFTKGSDGKEIYDSYYWQNGNGRSYGFMRIRASDRSIGSDLKIGLSITGSINPNGSPNLEPQLP